MFKISDKIIVHTEVSKTELIEEGGVSKNKVVVIPHGIMENVKRINKFDAKRKLGLSLSNRQQENEEYLIEEFTWKSVAKKTLLVYLSLLTLEDYSVYLEKPQVERLKWLKRKIRGETVEVGCSGGYVSNFLQCSIGIDIDILRLKMAKIAFPHLNLICASADKIPLKNKSFDTLILPEILEHLNFSEVGEVLKEAVRVSKKAVLITLPSINGRYAKNPEHIWLPSEYYLRKLGENLNRLGLFYEITRTPDFVLIRSYSKS